MFGHQNDVITQDQKQDADVPLPDSALTALTGDPVVTPPTDNPSPAQSTPAITLDGSDTPQLDTQSSGTKQPHDTPVDPDFNATTSALSTSRDESRQEARTPHPSNGSQHGTKSSNVEIHTDDLLDIKNEALHDLTPLVGELDLNSEDKFKTIMMLIQASDNKDLIPEAYKFAKQISDEKLKAQALLDVVNEINYFTQRDSDKN